MLKDRFPVLALNYLIDVLLFLIEKSLLFSESLLSTTYLRCQLFSQRF